MSIKVKASRSFRKKINKMNALNKQNKNSDSDRFDENLKYGRSRNIDLYWEKDEKIHVYRDDSEKYQSSTIEDEKERLRKKKKEEEPKKQGFLSKMANMFTNKDGGGDKKSDTSLSSIIPTGDATKDDFYNAGETLRQMGWKPDDIAKRIGDNLPYMDDEKDIPMMKNSDDKEDWINLYKKSIAMKKAGYSSSEIADKLRANL